MEIGLLYFSIQPKHVAEATPEIPRAIKPTDANLISFMMLLQKNAALKATPLAPNVIRVERHPRRQLAFMAGEQRVQLRSRNFLRACHAS